MWERECDCVCVHFLSISSRLGADSFVEPHGVCMHVCVDVRVWQRELVCGYFKAIFCLYISYEDFLHTYFMFKSPTSRDHLCCSVMQHVAVCCSLCCSVLQCVLQYVAVNVAVCAAVPPTSRDHLCCSVMQRVAVCCSVCCSVLQCVLQYVAVNVAVCAAVPPTSRDPLCVHVRVYVWEWVCKYSK